MSIVSAWFRNPFCFPCVKRTKMLSEALEVSKTALAVRQAAISHLKESINERHTEPALN